MSLDPAHIMWGNGNTQVNLDLGWTIREQYVYLKQLSSHWVCLSSHSNITLVCWLLSHPLSSLVLLHATTIINLPVKWQTSQIRLLVLFKISFPILKTLCLLSRIPSGQKFTKAIFQTKFSLEGELWWVKMQLLMNLHKLHSLLLLH